MTSTDQPERLWERFYDVLHNGEYEAANQIITYCNTVGLDITAASMKEMLDKANFIGEPSQD